MDDIHTSQLDYKGSANRLEYKAKDEVFVFISEVPPIFAHRAEVVQLYEPAKKAKGGVKKAVKTDFFEG